MNENQREQALLKKAKERVKQRMGLIIHIVCWLVISMVIVLAVPEKAMGVRVGFLVFGFWGICVVIHAIAYILSSRRFTRGYDDAVQRELDRIKSEK